MQLCHRPRQSTADSGKAGDVNSDVFFEQGIDVRLSFCMLPAARRAYRWLTRGNLQPKVVEELGKMGHVVKMVEGEDSELACFGELFSDAGALLLLAICVFQAIAGSCLGAARSSRRRWILSLASSSGPLVAIPEETDTLLRRSSVASCCKYCARDSNERKLAMTQPRAACLSPHPPDAESVSYAQGVVDRLWMDIGDLHCNTCMCPSVHCPVRYVNDPQRVCAPHAWSVPACPWPACPLPAPPPRCLPPSPQPTCYVFRSLSPHTPHHHTHSTQWRVSVSRPLPAVVAVPSLLPAPGQPGRTTRTPTAIGCGQGGSAVP